MNGDHTAFFNSRAEAAVRAVSHKVYAKRIHRNRTGHALRC